MLGGNPAKVAWLSKEPIAEVWWEKPRSQPKNEAKWVCEHLTNEIWWDEPKIIQKENRVYHSIEIAPTNPKFVITVLGDKNRVYLSMRINPAKVMYLLSQVLSGKVDQGENGLQVAHRETYEETGLNLTLRRFKHINRDSRYKCEVYAVKLQGHEEL